MDAKTHFAKSQEHWQQMAECAKAAGLDDMAKVCSDRSAHYKAMHSDAAVAASKAALDELNKSRKELQPTQVSAIAPPNPNLRAVTRPGQPQIEKVQVDPEFEHLVKVADVREE
jgi:hypothetical protein